MAARINPKWKELIREKMGKAPCHINQILDFAPSAKWLVAVLANRNIPFKVINLGAGVKRITTDVETCPKCNGTGKC